MSMNIVTQRDAKVKSFQDTSYLKIKSSQTDLNFTQSAMERNDSVGITIN